MTTSTQSVTFGDLKLAVNHLNFKDALERAKQTFQARYCDETVERAISLMGIISTHISKANDYASLYARVLPSFRKGKNLGAVIADVDFVDLDDRISRIRHEPGEFAYMVCLVLMQYIYEKLNVYTNILQVIRVREEFREAFEAAVILYSKDKTEAEARPVIGYASILATRITWVASFEDLIDDLQKEWSNYPNTRKLIIPDALQDLEARLSTIIINAYEISITLIHFVDYWLKQN